MIKSIPWKYDGIQFRSKLEARWYAAFKLSGVSVEYEPIAIEVYDTHGRYVGNWLPDFLVMEMYFVEIKPLLEINEMQKRDKETVRNATIAGYETPTILIFGCPRKFLALEVIDRHKGNPEFAIKTTDALYGTKFHHCIHDWYPDEDASDLRDFSLEALRRMNLDCFSSHSVWSKAENAIQWNPQAV